MHRTKLLISATVVCLAIYPNCRASAQSYLEATGDPAYSVNIPVPNGSINVTNGNLHLEIPVSTLKQRGQLQLDEKLVYDSRIWMIVQYDHYYWWPLNVPNSNGGWRFVKGNETGTIVADPSLSHSQTSQCVKLPRTYLSYQSGWDVYDWTDPSGTTHTFDAVWSWEQMPAACLGYVRPITQTVSGYATDASGYSIKMSGTTSSPGPSSLTIVDSQGVQVYPQVIDRFGNYWSPSGSSDLVDDLGRIPVVTTVNGNVTYYDVLAANGTPDSNGIPRIRYTVTTESINLSTAFNQSGVVEYQNNGNPPGSDHPPITTVQSIGLPDGSSYQFTYDSYGEIQTMTLPTGGVVNYGWGNYEDSYKNVNRWITSNTIDGGTTTYNPSVISNCSSNGTGCQEQVNVHRPSGDETVYTMTLDNGAWDTNTVTYQGAASQNLPKFAVTTTYDFSNTCSLTCTGSKDITKSSEVDALPDAGIQTQIQTAYANPQTGQMTSWSQWDYYTTGSTPSTTPTRQINYVYTGHDINSETHLDQYGNTASNTIYNYTTTATPTSGIVSHGTANAGGPYLTSVTKVTPTPSQSLTAYFTYDDTGSAQTYTDYDGHPATSYKYDPTDTFVVETDKPSTTTQGLTYLHITKASFDPNTGASLSTDDENSVANGQSYSVRNSYEPIAGRISSITKPDGGSETYNYPSPNEVDKSELQTSGVTVSTASFLDAYGRASKMLSNGISSEKSYDPNGRLYGVTNAHLASQTSPSPTDGTTYTLYDTLNRVTSIQEPDGHTISSQRYGNMLTTFDEIGNQTQYTYNAFDEISSVQEADPSTGLPALLTMYQRDGLGNVTCIEQHGEVSGTGCSSPSSSDPSSAWRVRRFFYNRMSQLIAAEIPEHMSMPNSPPAQNCGTVAGSGPWTDCYSYDGNGNLQSTVDNRGVTKSFTFDALNRMTSIQSPTLNNSYFYDAGQNGLSHLWMQTNNLNSSSQYGYDVMGRTVSEKSCRPSTWSNGVCASSQAKYDLVGNLRQVNYPDGQVVQTNTFDDSNRLNTVSYAQAGTSTSLWSNPSYAPPGELTAATLGTSIQMTASFNSRQAMTALNYQSSQQNYFQKTYQWDANAKNLLFESDLIHSTQRQFVYDKLNRLISGQDYGAGGSYAFGQVTVSGHDGSQQVCIGGGNPGADSQSDITVPIKCTIIWDAGTVNLTIGGYTVSAPYGQGDTDVTIAKTLADILDAPGSNSLVHALANGSSIQLTSNIVGATGDYSLSSSSAEDFTLAFPSGSTMSGGQTGSAPQGGLNQQYTLDNWGNLSAMGVTSGFAQPVNFQNQVTTFSYDAAGRLISDQQLGYVYDDNNMLISSNDGESYGYDAANQRTSVTTGAANTEYYYYRGRLMAQQNISTGLWTDFLYAGGARLAQIVGTQLAVPIFTLNDHIGSDVMDVDINGNVMNALNYTPFGQLLSGSSLSGFVFTGLLRDNTGLDHASKRQYSSTTGRWTVPDPYNGSYDQSNPQSMNRYAYVGNRPLSFVDPSGQDGCGLTDPGCTVSADGDSDDTVGEIISAVIDGIEDSFSFLFGDSSFHGSVKNANEGKTSQAPAKLSAAQCAALNKILGLESQYGTQAAAAASSNTFSNSGILQAFNSTSVPNVQTPAGQLDLDWFTDLAATRAPIGEFSTTAMRYTVAKLAWTGVRAYFGIPIGHSLPFTDPGENLAVVENMFGAKYSDIFTPSYMQQVCGK